MHSKIGINSIFVVYDDENTTDLKIKLVNPFGHKFN